MPSWPGLLSQRLHGGPAAAATAIGVMGCASLAINVVLILACAGPGRGVAATAQARLRLSAGLPPRAGPPGQPRVVVPDTEGQTSMAGGALHDLEAMRVGQLAATASWTRRVLLPLNGVRAQSSGT